MDYSCYIYFITVKKKFEENKYNKIKRFIQNTNGPKDSSYNFFKYRTYKYGIELEQLVYIGETTDIKGRFSDGHKAALLLNNPKYDNSEKRIYLARIATLTTQEDFIHLEAIKPKRLVKNILRLIESVLIPYFDYPIFNDRDKIPKLFFLNKKNNREWSKTAQADFINIKNFEGNSILFSEEYTIPLPSYLMLAIDNLSDKELRNSLYKDKIVKSILKKVL